jgi:hypothetical protein
MNSLTLEKVTLNLYQGDIARIRAVAGEAGASLLIRTIVAAFLERNEAQMPTPPVLTDLVEAP